MSTQKESITNDIGAIGPGISGNYELRGRSNDMPCKMFIVELLENFWAIYGVVLSVYKVVKVKKVVSDKMTWIVDVFVGF